MGPLLELRDVTVRYGGLTAVADVSFDVEPGGYLGGGGADRRVAAVRDLGEGGSPDVPERRPVRRTDRARERAGRTARADRQRLFRRPLRAAGCADGGARGDGACATAPRADGHRARGGPAREGPLGRAAAHRRDRPGPGGEPPPAAAGPGGRR